MFEGLFIYEIVLLILGVVLFFLSLFVLIYFVIKKRTVKSIIPLFLVSIIMIAYPSIQKIKVENGVIEIEKSIQETDQDPENPAQKENLEKKLDKINIQRITDRKTLLKMMNAYRTLNRPQKAQAIRKRLDSLPGK